VTKQLRLVDDPEANPGSDSATRPVGSRRAASGRTSSGRSSSGRRGVRWGEWQLDSRTRSVGRAGVAAAREALERVAAEQERARAARGDDGQRLAS
jgi:hypothetical protein